MDREKYRKQAQVLRNKKFKAYSIAPPPPKVENGIVKLESLPKNIGNPRLPNNVPSIPLHPKSSKDKKGCSGCKRK